MAIIGSQVYDEHGHHDSGVPDVATYVSTRGGLVVADRHGTVWLSHSGREPQPIGRCQRAVHLLTDAELQEVGWVTDLDAYRVTLQVVDTQSSKPLGTVSLPHYSQLVGLDGDSVYVRDHAPHLLRIRLATGDTSIVPLRHPLAVEAVTDAHLLVFVPRRSHLAPVDDLAQRQHVPLVDVISPGLRYGTGLEGDDVRDLVTGRRVPIQVPTGPHEKVTFYGWLGPRAVAFEKFALTTGRWNYYSCDLVAAGCHLAVSVRPGGLVGPGSWAPPAG